MHCLTQHSAKTSSDLEGRNESSCWNRKREGQDGEAKGGEDVAGQRYKDAVSVRVLPVFDVVILVHAQIGFVLHQIMTIVSSALHQQIVL